MQTYDLPANVHRQVRESGRVRYTYQAGRGTVNAGPRIRLPDNPLSPEFTEAIEIARGTTVEQYQKMQPKWFQEIKAKNTAANKMGIGEKINAAKNRSKEKGLPFDLTPDFIVELMKSQEMRCAVTGIFMNDQIVDDPRAWSIDRIQGHLGYVKGNVRLVCRMTNMGMNKWGDKEFLSFIKDAYTNRYRSGAFVSP